MPKNEIFQTKNLVRLALVAALYAALTLALPGLSFPAIQFRFRRYWCFCASTVRITAFR